MPKKLTADRALHQLKHYDFTTVLDIGSGAGEHAKILRQNNRLVTTNALHEGADIVGDFMDIDFPQFDCIWASHVLEHQRNPGAFLDKCFSLLPEGGVLAVTVPPRKDQIVGGHVTLWNKGLLLYNLILAGFDCSEAWAESYGYNVSVIVKKKTAVLPKLDCDGGDIVRLAEFFPFPVKEGFNGL